MIVTQESLDSAEGKLILQYNWFHPNRIAYHMYRLFHALFQSQSPQSSAIKQALLSSSTSKRKENKNLSLDKHKVGENKTSLSSLELFQYLYEFLLIKYAFPYSKLLGLYTMHYMQSIRSLQFVSEDNILSSSDIIEKEKQHRQQQSVIKSGGRVAAVSSLPSIINQPMQTQRQKRRTESKSSRSTTTAIGYR